MNATIHIKIEVNKLEVYLNVGVDAEESLSALLTLLCQQGVGFARVLVQFGVGALLE